jgi:hypothetical protein
MLHALLTFVPVAVLLSITPGVGGAGRPRARRAFAAGGWGRRVERLTGAVLIGLGIRLALERR